MFNKTINKVVMIDVEKIVPNANQPRKQFEQEDINRLADSINKNGLIQPVTIRQVTVEENGSKTKQYELVAGERRLRAVKLLQRKYIEAIIVTITDGESSVFALVENIQRSGLNYFEEALAIRSLITVWELSQKEVGLRLGMAQSTVANKLRLLKFTDEAMKYMLDSGISERQARELLKLPENRVIEAVDYISVNRLSTSQTETYISCIAEPKQEPIASKRRIVPIIRDVRIFVNSINKAVDIMNSAGIDAITQKIENDTYIEYYVKIPIQNVRGNNSTS